MSDIDENSDRRLSDTSEKYEGTEHYTLVKTKDGWHGDPDGYSWQWFDFPDITFTDDGDCHFELEAEAIDPEIPYVNAVERDKILHLGQERAIPFDLDKNVVFEKEIFLPEHSNGMRFKALDADGRVLLNEVYFSVGGGTVARQDEMASRSEREPYKVPYDFESCSQLMTLCLTSTDPKFDEIYLSNFATINVLDVIRRIPGVGRVSNIGSRYYAMQIWAQPDKLANFGLTVQDLQNALKDQNRESAAGVLGQQPVEGLDITIPITTQGRLSTVGQFEDIVVRANANGSIIRLKDVARVSLEASSYNTESGINGENAAVLGIYMLPGANAMEVAERVKEAMDEISENFPEGLSYEIPFDMTTYISESIHEVYKTLFEALVLVVLVVYLSLQSWRATLIPIVAVPILSLIHI